MFVGRTVESERNGTDWAKGRTEILNWIGLLVWVGRRVEVEESCGIFLVGGFEGQSAGLHKITYGDPSPEHTRGDGVLWIFGPFTCLTSSRRSSTGALTTVLRRYYPMNRDKRCERVKVVVDGLVAGVGTAVEDSGVVGAIRSARTNDKRSRARGNIPPVPVLELPNPGIKLDPIFDTMDGIVDIAVLTNVGNSTTSSDSSGSGGGAHSISRRSTRAQYGVLVLQFSDCSRWAGGTDGGPTAERLQTFGHAEFFSFAVVESVCEILNFIHTFNSVFEIKLQIHCSSETVRFSYKFTCEGDRPAPVQRK
ncbi:hypothetical protein B0H14DRAFT_3608938 [Mycena olivaceomarginata]|nr:hypothetical protein B0H14DRAFT_3608938 [Mycena olivaceomarginata]